MYLEINKKYAFIVSTRLDAHHHFSYHMEGTITPLEKMTKKDLIKEAIDHVSKNELKNFPKDLIKVVIK